MPKTLDFASLTDVQLEELAAVGLTDAEICNLLGTTLDKWRHNYHDIITKGRARLRQSLRRAQIKSALSGNASMLIWLGKQYLGQRDSRDVNLEAEHKAISITPNVLERLQTSYKLTLEQLRTRGRLEGPVDEAGGDPRDGGGVLKTAQIPPNQELSNGGAGLDSEGMIAVDDYVRVVKPAFGPGAR